MVAIGLDPTDPVRWYMAYAVERAQAEQQGQQGQPGSGDIEVLE